MRPLVMSFALWLFTATVLFGCQAFASNPGLPASGILSGYSGQMLPAVVATIPAAGATSNAIKLNGFSLVGILLPSTFTGATITFTVSVDGTNFFVLKSLLTGTSLSYTVTQGTYAAIDPVPFYGVHYLKIVSASTEGSARTLTLALKGI